MGVFTGEECLVYDGAVGARLIQASTHGHGGGGAVKLLPSVVDLVHPGRWRFLAWGGGFARDRTKPEEFFAPLTLTLTFLI